MTNEFFKLIGKTKPRWMFGTGSCIGQIVQYDFALAVITLMCAILMLGASVGDN